MHGSEKELIRSEKRTVLPWETSDRLYGNLYEGVARARNGAQITAEFNETRDHRRALMTTDGLIFEWRSPPKRVPSIKSLQGDFFSRPRGPASLPGALS